MPYLSAFFPDPFQLWSLTRTRLIVRFELWHKKKLILTGSSELDYNQSNKKSESYNVSLWQNTKERGSIPVEDVSIWVVWEPLAHNGLVKQGVES